MLILAALLTIQQTLQSLRTISVPEDETRVPPEARRLLKTAKAELRELATASLRGQLADPDAAAAHLHDALLVPDVPETAYGGLAIDVTTHGDTIAVDAQFAVPCGDDSALFLFRYDGAWKLVLDRESNDYDEISGGAGSLAFDVSPPDANGSVLVISADVSPWCTSNWQALRWRVDRVGRDHATLVTQQHDSVYLDDDLKLDATATGFSIEYGTHSADLGRLIRRRLLHYAVDTQNHITRIEPIARSSEDAADEWLRLRGAHVNGSFTKPVRLANGNWSLTLETDEGPDRAFVVAEKNGEFRVVSAKDASQ